MIGTADGGRSAQANIHMGFDVLRNARLPVPIRRAYHKTTGSHHRFRRHPNLLKTDQQQLQASGSERVWVAGRLLVSPCRLR